MAKSRAKTRPEFGVPRLALIAALLLSVPGVAQAQTVRIQPTLDTRLTWTDNVDTEEDGQQDWIAEISPGVSISRESGRFSGGLNMSLRNTFHAEQTEDNTTYLALQGRGALAQVLAVAEPVGTLWLKALLSGYYIGIRRIIGMRLRGVDPHVIVNAGITAHMAGIALKDEQLEAHYLARGNVGNVVRAIINASKARIDLSYDRACAIDLAGRDVLDAVKTSVKPKVIDCPDEGKVAAMAKNGIQVLAKARVTVRTNIKRLVGGATEETIIARVGEGIVSTIGSSETHKDVLENPDRISKGVLAKGLDAGTAFEILSIDIADVDIGDNIGARLQADQAEADKRVAQAAAESRRAMAVAEEQENIAAIAANRAKLVLAEAEVPQAMADAFRSGHLGILDYQRIKNLEADTRMRTQIAVGEETHLSTESQKKKLGGQE